MDYRTKACFVALFASMTCMAGSMLLSQSGATPVALNDYPPASKWKITAPDSGLETYYIPQWRIDCWGAWTPHTYSKSIQVARKRNLSLLLNSHETSFALSWNGQRIGPGASGFFERRRIHISQEMVNVGANRLDFTEVAALWSGVPVLADIHFGTTEEIDDFNARLALIEFSHLAARALLAIAAAFIFAAYRSTPAFPRRTMLAFTAWLFSQGALMAAATPGIKALLFRYQIEYTLRVLGILDTLLYAGLAFCFLAAPTVERKQLLIGLTAILIVGTGLSLIVEHAPEALEFSQQPSILAALTGARGVPGEVWRIPILLCAAIALFAGRRPAVCLLAFEGLHFLGDGIAKSIGSECLPLLHLATGVAFVLLEFRESRRGSFRYFAPADSSRRNP